MSDTILADMTALLDDLTKPKGSLGKLEDYALRMAGIQGRVPPRADRRAVFVLAGDHGVTDEGVSLYPRDVTAQMMANFMAGGAAVNVFARACGFDVYAVDAGVATDLPAWPALDPERSAPRASGGSPGFFGLKAMRGSANFAKGPAMTDRQFAACLENGRRLARFASRSGYELVAVGDMGIGNTTSAAALLSALGFCPDDMVDRGTGIDDATLERKRLVIAGALDALGPFPEGPGGGARAGAAFCGPELATAAGLMLGLADARVACVLDGFPITAAAALACRLNPDAAACMFAGHQSRVRGHRPVLDALGLDPILSLDMRLGEGTGAVLGGFVVGLACRVPAQMARFSQLTVSKAPSDEVDY